MPFIRSRRCRRPELTLLIALTFAGACAAERVLTDDVTSDDQPLMADGEPHAPNTLRVLTLQTPDGSGQTVHPDFAQMPRWSTPFLLVATPYTFGNATVENPSLYGRSVDFQWNPLGEKSNPIVRPTRGYLSDPDIVGIPSTGEARVYFRQVDTSDVIRMVRTRNGLDFDAGTDVVAGRKFSVISPAVVRRDSTHWRMWSVNASKGGCTGDSTAIEMRKSPDGEHWSKPQPVTLTQPGFFAWHIDVQWIPSLRQYWALYNVKTAGSCATKALFLATSEDGLTWLTYPSPVIAAGVIPEFAAVVYRSTFAYDPATDRVRLWYSGAHIEKTSYIWSSAFDRRDRAELFAAIAAPAAANVVHATAERPGVVFNPP